MNVRSMTGFGRAEGICEDARISVEMKSVNSRFFDLNLKMPRRLNALEGDIRSSLKEKIRRGKLDVYISYEDYREHGKTVHADLGLAQEYLKRMLEMKSRLEELAEMQGEKDGRIDFRLRPLETIFRMPEIFTTSEMQEEEELWEKLSPVLEEAIRKFVETRGTEGEFLRRDLLLKLTEMEELVERIEARSPELRSLYEARLTEKIRELLGDAEIDPQRILTEAAIYADKICTDEEMVRLHSHIAAMRNRLLEGGDVGRELDFLAQEMNREANTTLSKANDITVSQDAISLKTMIEKIREQVQNLE